MIHDLSIFQRFPQLLSNVSNIYIIYEAMQDDKNKVVLPQGYDENPKAVADIFIFFLKTILNTFSKEFYPPGQINERYKSQMHIMLMWLYKMKHLWIPIIKENLEHKSDSKFVYQAQKNMSYITKNLLCLSLSFQQAIPMVNMILNINEDDFAINSIIKNRLVLENIINPRHLLLMTKAYEPMFWKVMLKHLSDNVNGIEQSNILTKIKNFQKYIYEIRMRFKTEIRLVNFQMLSKINDDESDDD